jgi:hypothetical protein
MMNRPSPSHSAVVVVASSSPPRGGHFRVTPSAHSSHEGPVVAFPPFVASLKDSNWHVEGSLDN